MKTVIIQQQNSECSSVQAGIEPGIYGLVDQFFYC